MSKLGVNLGYVDGECPNCGRYRVELYSSNKRVCEKCNWCIEEGDYYYPYYFENFDEETD